MLSLLPMTLDPPGLDPGNSGLISLRIDWFDLLAVQGTLKSLLQHHSSKASVLLCSAFFIIQLSHPYVTTRKTIALKVEKTARPFWYDLNQIPYEYIVEVRNRFKGLCLIDKSA